MVGHLQLVVPSDFFFFSFFLSLPAYKESIFHVLNSPLIFLCWHRAFPDLLTLLDLFFCVR